MSSHRQRTEIQFASANRSEQPHEILTAGRAFSDGSMIDLIREGSSDEETKLLVWDGTNPHIAEHAEFGGKIYIPENPSSAGMGAMRLPTQVQPFGSTRQLFDGVCRLLTELHGLPSDVVAKLAYFIFATWLSDQMVLAPLLSIVAPPTTSGGALLRTLSLLCRRPLWLGDVSPSRLRTLPLTFGPTLLLDLVEAKAELRRWLRASMTCGMLVPSGRGAVDHFCAKVICTQEPLNDLSLLSLALQIELTPSSLALPISDLKRTEEIAKEFQAKFQMYRFMSYAQVCAPAIDLTMLTAPGQDVARMLGSALVGDLDLQLELFSAILPQDQNIKIERGEMLEAVVAEALWFSCHDKNLQVISLGDLTTRVNTLLGGRGESRQVSPESVGRKLKSLGVHRGKLPNGNKEVSLSEVTKAQIHRVAQAIVMWGMPPWSGCQHCTAPQAA